MVYSYWRGHKIERSDGIWVYSDTKEPVAASYGGKPRPCGKCGKRSKEDEPDPCLGKLPGVDNACCGHGDRGAAYIQFKNGVRVSGFTLTQ